MDPLMSQQFQLFMQFQQFLQLQAQSQNSQPQLSPNQFTNNNAQSLIRVPSLDESSTTQETNRSQVLQQIDISLYKTQPCLLQIPHNTKQCPYYHGYSDRKRIGLQYSAELCETTKECIPCPNYAQCPRSHNIVEVLYRPEKYKSRFCQHFFNIYACEYGFYCPYAHCEAELSTESIHNLEYDDDFYLFHFKTVWCPFIFFQHNRESCAYAHDFHDFRRKPHIYTYLPIECQQWGNQLALAQRYEDKCQTFCQKCHSKFELMFHPLFYKSKQCQHIQPCPLDKGICPYYHGQQDQRIIPQEIQSGLFKYIPRNRVVAGIFKSRLTQVFQPTQTNQVNGNNVSVNDSMNFLFFNSVAQQNQSQMDSDQIDKLTQEFENMMS